MMLQNLTGFGAFLFQAILTISFETKKTVCNFVAKMLKFHLETRKNFNICTLLIFKIFQNAAF